MLLWAFALVGLALTCRAAPAQIVFEFANNTAPFTAITSLTVSPGTPQTVRVYLHETPSSAPNLNGGGGMLSGGVRVVTGDVTRATVAGLPATTANGGLWTSGNNTFAADQGAGGSAFTAANSAQVSDFVFPPALGGTPVPADNAGRILLGLFTITALNSSAVTFTARDPNGGSPGDNTSNLNGGTGLDPSIGNATLAVNAVPEPGTLMLSGLAAVGLAAFRRRNRKTAVVETEAAQA